MMNKEINECPCGTEKLYSECCQKAHVAPVFIITAEELMRSRYTAFTLINGAYLLETHHSSTRHNIDQDDLEAWAKSVEWVRLEIINSTDGKATDSTGTVEFKAYFKEKNRLSHIHENSYFEKEYGSWKYVEIV